MVESKHEIVQEIVADTGVILQKINSVVNELLGRMVEGISDEEKQAEALRTVEVLCNSLGISDLELT